MRRDDHIWPIVTWTAIAILAMWLKSAITITMVTTSTTTAIIEGFSPSLCRYSAHWGSESWLSNRDSRDSYLHDDVSRHGIEHHKDGEVEKSDCFMYFNAFGWPRRLWQNFYVNWRSGDTSWLVGCNLKLIGKSQLGRSHWSLSSSLSSWIWQ